MREFLSQMIGKKVDVFCGGAASLSGEVVKLEGDVLHLRDDEERIAYVALEKIVVVWEARDEQPRAGFFSGTVNSR